MRISNYPTDTITGAELILATDVDTSTQKYKTVNFTVNTLKSFVNTVIPLTGAGSTIDTEDLTASRALISNSSGKVAVSSVTSTELAYLDITTLGTSETSKAVTASAGGIVKLTGELQVSYASPRIFFEDTGSNRADTLVHQLNDLFRIDTRANGGSFVTALDIDASLANPTVTIHKKLSMSSGANIESTNDISAGQFKVPNLNSAPASASASGTQGDIVFANDAIYVCVSTNTWKKAALSTF